MCVCMDAEAGYDLPQMLCHSSDIGPFKKKCWLVSELQESDYLWLLIVVSICMPLGNAIKHLSSAYWPFLMSSLERCMFRYLSFLKYGLSFKVSEHFRFLGNGAFCCFMEL